MPVTTARDFSGPILFAFPAEPVPISIASDTVGKVFASQLSTPDIIEPTDVRQVWIATGITGSDGARISLRSSQGKYLSCDKVGMLSATREAIGPQEEFTPVRNPDAPEFWGLQNVYEKFVCCAESEIRGDSGALGFREGWRVRIQARFLYQGENDSSNNITSRKSETKVSKEELERLAGRELDLDEVRDLRRAKRDGRLNEALLDLRIKTGRNDKFG